MVGRAEPREEPEARERGEARAEWMVRAERGNEPQAQEPGEARAG